MEQNMQQSCTDNRNIPTAEGATAETPPCATSAPDNFAIKQKILQKLQEYDNILLVRHVRPDGDALGSVRGLAQVLRRSLPEKHIYATGADTSDYLAFMGADDALPPEETCRRALCIALDVATPDRASGEAMSLAAETLKIDHHVETVPCEGLSWVEEKRSSTCEMVAELCLTFPDVLKLDITSATALYIGIVTDSGRFRFSSTSPETLRISAALLEYGIDTETMYSNLYLEPFETLRARSAIVSKIRRTPHGVAYLHLTRAMQEKYHLSYEAAGNMVSAMNSIDGCPIWIAFIDTDDGTAGSAAGSAASGAASSKVGNGAIRVRLRSRFVPVRPVAEKYHGGGHDFASGATVYSTRELRALLRDADKLLEDAEARN